MSPLLLTMLLAGVAVGDATDRSTRVLFDFTDEASVGNFRPINDGVMGGVSSGTLVGTGEEGAVFQGVVSFDNNGGFASVRSLPGAFHLAGYEGITLEVRGDGKTYKCLLRTSEAFDGLQYQARFQPPRERWETVVIPFSAFVPTFRGRVVEGAPALDPARIASVGLMISDRQEGPFRLSIARIGAYRSAISRP